MNPAQHHSDVEEPLLPGNAWLQAALAMLAQLAPLEPDWDGYGSRAIQPGALQAARTLLAILDRDPPPLPRVVPVSGGGLQLAWTYAGRELEFAIGPNGSIDYLKAYDDEVEDGPLSIADERSARQLIRWLVGKAA